MTKSPRYLFRTFKAFQKAIVVPDGFSMTVEDLYDDYTKSRYVDVILKNATVGTTIRFNLTMDKLQKWDIRGDRGITIKELKPYLGKSVIVWNGHVNYTHNGGHYSYDRRGVEDSFYNGNRFDENPNDQITEQLARIEASRGRIDDSVEIPVIGRLINKGTLEDVKQGFKKGAIYSSYPSGFGTAYNISPKRSKHAIDRAYRASEKLEKFFEHSPLYITENEMD